MKVETKFDIGQEVYFIGFGDVIYSGKIEKIETYFTKNIKDIIYNFEHFINFFCEDQLFSTREEAEAKLKEINND